MEVVPTGNNSDWVLPVSISLGVVLLLLLILLICLVKKRKIRLDFLRKLITKKSNSPSKPENVYEKFLNINEKKIKEEFVRLCQESQNYQSTKETAQKPNNVKKNRYKNILPYDNTRVKLVCNRDDDSESDYVNASYIKGYSGKVEYIATQGPMSTTWSSFWKMIVQENVNLIVMVANFIENGSNKCYKYFPDVGEHQNEDDIHVKCINEKQYDTYCIRELKVEESHNKRGVTHLQYLNWPDFGVPDNVENMITFRDEMRRLHKSGPILIHCSAGVGRTGTLIVLDIAFQAVQDNKSVNIENIVIELRKQRALMVQTEIQILFIYKTLAEYIMRVKS